ncbi:MAG: hypothetical protein Q9181_006983 [Wetmoreana brouardii]
MAVTFILTDTQKGAAGRPLLSVVIELVLSNTTAITEMASSDNPSLQINGLPSISESDSASSSPATTKPPSRTARLQDVYKAMRPPPFTHTWYFVHERAPTDSTAAATDYSSRQTTLLEDIKTVKPFMQLLNNFPLANLKMKDSIHFFKRGVRPVWEDPRNVRGGAWTFRVNKSISAEFWTEVLYMAVGEQIGGVVSPGKFPSVSLPHPSPFAFARPNAEPTVPPLTPRTGDDICGLSLSRRFSSDLILIWNRRADLQPSVDAIRDVVLAQLSPELKPKEGSFYYKRHSDHAGFAEVVAAGAAGAAGKAEELTGS